MKFAFIMLFAIIILAGQVHVLCSQPNWQPHPPVLTYEGKPVRVYMIYHPEKEKWLGEAAIGGFTSWVEPNEATVLPSRKDVDAKIGSLRGSKDDVELKAFLLLSVGLKKT